MLQSVETLPFDKFLADFYGKYWFFKNRFSHIIIRFSDFEINRLINRFLKTGFHP